jgi:hypothetical protein
MLAKGRVYGNHGGKIAHPAQYAAVQAADEEAKFKGRTQGAPHASPCQEISCQEASCEAVF